MSNNVSQKLENFQKIQTQICKYQPQIKLNVSMKQLEMYLEQNQLITDIPDFLNESKFK